uniref:Uncharacterized protein n=1 Tax=Chromera velia CCMP2878 TaxID=1169474 RepID=A0A0G4GWX9_9ALVE|eukprot:Cvel_5338.t1-p1 / transcript=Cvel_5338.t1 / gene=Cvel_5338 / organism=Chromera_velia_CCMP2878 / gene_product=hypothetical protein / transcript_product=hypothetical protein / location=Cvel_scaffold247:85401-85754(+) / protein_length=118 / sequence_SO=supercontig / SO=protein_coding / is_pseudo=false
MPGPPRLPPYLLLVLFLPNYMDTPLNTAAQSAPLEFVLLVSPPVPLCMDSAAASLAASLRLLPPVEQRGHLLSSPSEASDSVGPGPIAIISVTDQEGIENLTSSSSARPQQKRRDDRG